MAGHAAADVERELTVPVAEELVEFGALLESLQEKAKSLQHDSEHVDRPEELSQAVDRARASLSDALSLSDRLLEAYREAVQQDESDMPGQSTSDDSA